MQLGGGEHSRRRPHQVQIGPRGGRRRAVRRLDHARHPIVVGRRAAATVGQQRHRHAGNAGQENLVQRLFQDVEARHAEDGIDLAIENDLHDRRRALGDEDAVAEPLGAGLQFAQAQAPQLRQCNPAASQGAGQVSASRRHCGNSSSRRWQGTAATWSCQKAEASATIVQPQVALRQREFHQQRPGGGFQLATPRARERSHAAAISAAAAAIRSRRAFVAGTSLRRLVSRLSPLSGSPDPSRFVAVFGCKFNSCYKRGRLPGFLLSPPAAAGGNGVACSFCSHRPPPVGVGFGGWGLRLRSLGREFQRRLCQWEAANRLAKGSHRKHERVQLLIVP